jgi:hypothetical protein
MKKAKTTEEVSSEQAAMVRLEAQMPPNRSGNRGNRARELKK